MQKAVLSCWFDGYNQRDWNAVQSIYSDDAIIHGKDGPLKGGQAVVGIAKKWLETIPDAQLTPLHMCKEDDVVVAHWRAEGTLKGPIGDIVASGEKVVFHGITCFRCREGQVIEQWATIDYRPLKSPEPLSMESVRG